MIIKFQEAILLSVQTLYYMASLKFLNKLLYTLKYVMTKIFNKLKDLQEFLLHLSIKSMIDIKNKLPHPIFQKQFNMKLIAENTLAVS